MHPHLQLASVLPPNPNLIALCIGSTVIARYSANELFIKDIISLGLYLTFGGLHLLHNMGQTHLKPLSSVDSNAEQAFSLFLVQRS